jgi:hypothetical protein
MKNAYDLVPLAGRSAFGVRRSALSWPIANADTVGRIRLVAVLAIFSLLPLPAAETPADLDLQTLRTFAEQLTGIPRRGMGEPGADLALALIEARLQAAGLNPIRVRTTVSVPVDRGSFLTVGDKLIRLIPHQPNQAATAGTGGVTISGRLVFAGSGSLPELSGKDLAGNIVVLDGTTREAWTNIAGLGAAAVIIGQGEQLDRYRLSAQATTASIAFPRFLADLDPALDGAAAKLTSTVAWEPRAAWSLLALIPGSAKAKETVILTAGYEANGPIENLGPGATRAWNAALLTELACALAAKPVERNTLVFFNGGRGEMMRGLRHLVAALTLDRDNNDLLAEKNRFADQRDVLVAAAVRARLVAGALERAAQQRDATITSLIKDLAAAAKVETKSLDDEQQSLAKLLVEQVLATEAGIRADALLERLDTVRERYAKRKLLKLPEAEVAGLKLRLKTEEPIYNDWRSLQQRLDYGKPLSDAENAKIRELLPLASATLARHRAVLDQRVEDAVSTMQARTALAGFNPIHLVAFDFSDGNSRFSSTTSGLFAPWVNDLNWLHKALLKLAETGRDNGEPPSAYDPAPQQLISDAEAYWPEGYQHEAGLVGYYLPAVTFSTTNDARLKLGCPSDTAAAFRAETFLRQCTGLMPLLRAYLDCSDIANRKPRSTTFKDVAIRVEARCTGSKSGRRPFPFPFSLVVMGTRSEWLGDVRACETWWGDLLGEAVVPALPENIGGNGLPVFIYGFGNQGDITSVLASAGQQKASADLRIATNAALRDLLALVFRAVPSQLYNTFDPRLLAVLPMVSPLAATRNAAPNFAHVEISGDGQVAIFSEAGTRLLVTAAQGKIGNRLVILGEPTAKTGYYQGRPPGNLARLTPLDTAEDMLRLNDQRLTMLRTNGIDSDSLVTLHSQAERQLKTAQQSWQERAYAAATGAAQSSWAFASRVYPAVLKTANDVVLGLVVLLAFAIPFAVICERLFLSGSTIFGKVAGFAGFFIATFLFFFFFHPAFSLATTPMIIFLAFLIIMMSVWVIAIIFGRFEQEMEAIRMSGLGQHKADVSRLGTLFATVSLGISNMRRRPLRTFLTGITVVLMTFILLTFASFNPSLGAQRINLDTTPSYQGLLLRQNGWTPMAERALERVRCTWGDRVVAHPLRWLQPSSNIPKFPVSGPDDSSYVIGVVGCQPGDPTGLESALVRGPLDGSSPRGFGPTDEDWLFLPEEILRRIKVKPGAPVGFRGQELRAGVLDSRRLGSISQLGGELPTPLALEVLDANQQKEIDRLNTLSADGTPMVETTSFVHLGPNTVAVAREPLVARWGGTLRGISLTPRSNQVDLEPLAQDMAQQLALTLRVGDKGEAYLLTGVGRLSVAGLGSVLIPLILGGMIIFSTMLNSVAERGREIFIYASLGLAPIHVAALFLVEAGIYAVLGGMGGYMLAQFIVWGLGVAANLGYGVQPDLNYSSFTAVITILLVMATVLLSALYPAVVASRAANPGTADFRLPKPDGDRLEIPFPFTVSRRDIRGLLAYLVRYFEIHNESSTGCFTAAEAVLQADAQRYAVTAKVWLAPFDLGISQRFTMVAVPTDVKAIYSIHITLDLLSGQRSNWRRANVAFLKELRLQFLVWRTLTPETMDQYRAIGGDEDARVRVAAAQAAAAAAASGPLPVAPTATAGATP